MKKQLDLNQMGLVEMNSNEMEQVEGGGIFGAIIGFIVGVTLALISSADGSFTINGQTADSSDWLAAGIIGAVVGGAVIPI